MKYEETKIIEKTKEICKENFPFCSDCPFSEDTGYDEDGNPDYECTINYKNNNEKTADELFKELGYGKMDCGQFGFIKYVKINSNQYFYGGFNCVYFYLKTKKIKIEDEQDFRVLKAINKKVEELQWD